MIKEFTLSNGDYSIEVILLCEDISHNNVTVCLAAHYPTSAYSIPNSKWGNPVAQYIPDSSAASIKKQAEQISKTIAGYQ